VDIEIRISDLVKQENAEQHPGFKCVRVMLDNFWIEGPKGCHQVFVFAPLGLNYTDFRNRFPEKVLEKHLFQQAMLLILLGLDVLHQLGVVHTGMLRLKYDLTN